MDLNECFSENLLKKRVMSVSRIITSDEVRNFFNGILCLNAENSNLPIHIFFNCNGGDIQAGLQLYDIIKTSRAPVYGYAVQLVGSMAAIAFQACKPRYALSTSRIHLHHITVGKLTVDQFFPDKKEETEKWIMSTEIQQNRLYDILSESCKTKKEEIRKLFGSYDAGRSFSAQEAKEVGLIDKIGFSLP